MRLWREPTEADRERWRKGPDPEPWWWIERCTEAATWGPERVVGMSVDDPWFDEAVERMVESELRVLKPQGMPPAELTLLPELVRMNMRRRLRAAIGEE